MILSRITTHDQHHVGVLDVDPTVGHCAASECGPQTGDRRAVSNPGLRFEIADPQAAHCLNGKIIQLVGVGTTADPSDTFTAIDSVSFIVLLDKGRITRLFNLACDFVEGIVPGDVFPTVRAWPAHLRFEQTAIVENILLERSAFRAECTAIDRMIGIALNVHDLWNGVLGFVTKRVNDYAAAHGTIWTSAARLCRARYLQPLRLRVDRSKVEAEG